MQPVARAMNARKTKEKPGNTTENAGKTQTGNQGKTMENAGKALGGPRETKENTRKVNGKPRVKGNLRRPREKLRKPKKDPG